MIDQSNLRRCARATGRNVVRLLSATFALGALACNAADRTTGITLPPSEPYASLRLNIHTATMSTVAPYDTLQLSATPYTVSGMMVQGLGSPTFTTNDTTLAVSPTGLVTARTATRGAGSFVVASLRDSTTDVTRTDTVFIVVTKTVPASPLATFSIRHSASDSLKVGVWDGSMKPQDSVFVDATAVDGTDLRPALAPVTAIHFTTSDANTATVATATFRAIPIRHPIAEPVGIVKGVQPGKVVITAATTYYGVTRSDSIVITIGNPVGALIGVQTASSPIPGGGMIRTFNPESITIGVGGTVVFSPSVIAPLKWDVVFDDPSAAQPSTISPLSATTGTGNIGPLPVPDRSAPDYTAQLLAICYPNGFAGGYKCAAARSFPRAGTYHYHSALYGTSGTVIVKGP